MNWGKTVNTHEPIALSDFDAVSRWNGLVKCLVADINALIDIDFELATMATNLHHLTDKRIQFAKAWRAYEIEMLRVYDSHLNAALLYQNKPDKGRKAAAKLSNQLRQHYANKAMLSGTEALPPEYWEIPTISKVPAPVFPKVTDNNLPLTGTFSSTIFGKMNHYRAHHHLTVHGAKAHVRSLTLVLAEEKSKQSSRDQRRRVLLQTIASIEREIYDYRSRLNPETGKRIWKNAYDMYCGVMRSYYASSQITSHSQAHDTCTSESESRGFSTPRNSPQTATSDVSVSFSQKYRIPREESTLTVTPPSVALTKLQINPEAVSTELRHINTNDGVHTPSVVYDNEGPEATNRSTETRDHCVEKSSSLSSTSLEYRLSDQYVDAKQSAFCVIIPVENRESHARQKTSRNMSAP